MGASEQLAHPGPFMMYPTKCSFRLRALAGAAFEAQYPPAIQSETVVIGRFDPLEWRPECRLAGHFLAADVVGHEHRLPRASVKA